MHLDVAESARGPASSHSRNSPDQSNSPSQVGHFPRLIGAYWSLIRIPLVSNFLFSAFTQGNGAPCRLLTNLNTTQKTMAAPTGATTLLEAAFQSAKEEFFASLTDSVKAKLDVSKLATADDVYKAADDIQKQQAKTKTFRGLKRIEPLIRALQEYTGVVDTYAQVNPEILCLIWVCPPADECVLTTRYLMSDCVPYEQGSLKFLLQAASALTAAFEKIVKVLGDIGRILPGFKQYAALFPSNDGIRRALCLFFEDMLDFYAVLLNFVTNKSTLVGCLFYCIENPAD